MARRASEPEFSGALEDNRFISEEISRLDNIIKDFLRFARPSEPRLELIKATTPFRELTALLGPELEKNLISLRHISSPIRKSRPIHSRSDKF